MNWIVALESLDADVVRTLLTVLTEDRDELVRTHRMAEQIDLAQLERAPIPVHPAARSRVESRGR